MKLFNARFFGGVVVVVVGLLISLTGFFSLLSSNSNILLGIALVVAGAIVIKLGFVLAKDEPPAGHRVSINTLRRARMLKKGQKNNNRNT